MENVNRRILVFFLITKNCKFNGFRPQGALWAKKFTFIINSNAPLEGNYYSIDMFIMVLDN